MQSSERLTGNFRHSDTRLADIPAEEIKQENDGDLNVCIRQIDRKPQTIGSCHTSSMSSLVSPCLERVTLEHRG